MSSATDTMRGSLGLAWTYASSTGFHERRGHAFHFLHLRERPARTVVTHVSSRLDFETSK